MVAILFDQIYRTRYGARIEILETALVLFAQTYRTVNGAWIEIFLAFRQDLSLISHVTERARIEM